MAHPQDNRRETDPLPCGCEPYTSTRCDDARRLWNTHAQAHKRSAAAYARWARDYTGSDELRAAQKAASEAWAAYCAHLGADYTDDELDTNRLVAIERERPKAQPTLAEFRAEEKHRQNQADAASEIAYMHASGGWD